MDVAPENISPGRGISSQKRVRVGEPGADVICVLRDDGVQPGNDIVREILKRNAKSEVERVVHGHNVELGVRVELLG